MQIYTKDKKLQQALERPEIEALLSYFQELQEPVILREVRQAFPQQQHLDKELDLLIDHRVISRQDRRYQFSLKPIVEYPTTELLTEFLQVNQGRYSKEELLVFLAEKHWSDELTETVAFEGTLPTRNYLEMDDFRLVTINRGEKLAETLPNYFKQISQPKLSPKLAGLVGDVNPDFFANQLDLILERVIEGQAPRRSSIFVESLLMSEVIVDTPTWQLTIPVYPDNFSLDVELPQEANPFFFSHQLAEKLLAGRESFSYLIKKKA
ncbi:DUF1803 domain-containing protein [Enterococcus pseudoavium]|uniref:DUF1803 domain-containing protein n=1 Tax=Enterococcus pseudoavium TaxID=44007 RepID=UPI00082D44CC|nr:DUF1803 domain-containing protein [Enterococcus pseudoavium]